MNNSLHHTALSSLHKLSASYCEALVKHAPLFFGMTVYGDASVYECHIDGEDAPLVIVVDGIAYETDEYSVSDLRY